MINSINCEVILCGSKGSRLSLIENKKSKLFLFRSGKPIIYFIIKQLLKTRISKIILPLDYKGNNTKKYIKKTFIKYIKLYDFINWPRLFCR